MIYTLLITTSLAVSAIGSPLVARGGPITLPLARHFNFTGSAKITEIDRARARSLRAKAVNDVNLPSKRSVFPVNIANELVSYSVEVKTLPQTIYVIILIWSTSQAGIGTPPTTCQSCGTYPLTAVS